MTRPKYGVSLTKTGEEKNGRKVYAYADLVIEYTKATAWAKAGYTHPENLGWRVFQRDLCGNVDRSQPLYAALDFDDVKVWVAWNR